MNRISLLAFPALLLALAPDAARACSVTGYPLRQMPRSVHLIATAAPDTVAVGEHGAHGQVVEVERIGGAAAEALDPSVRRVVLVAWGYDQRCNTIPWAGSARWAEPGTRGLFTALLRDRMHWAGGLPTLDVYTPDSQPYPQRGRGAQLPPDSLLPVEDYFALIGLLPMRGQSDAPAAKEYLPVFQWAERHPGLAVRYPASRITAHARGQIAYDRLRSFSAPVAGTYRFEARLGEEAPRVFYLRTPTQPSSEWNPPGGSAVSAEKRDSSKVEGYRFLSCTSASPGSLAVDCAPGRRAPREGTLSVLHAAEPGASLPRTWRGQVDLRLVGRQLPATDSALRRLLAELRTDPREMPARFVLDEEGDLRVEQTTRLPDGRTLHLSGTLVSPETLAEPR